MLNPAIVNFVMMVSLTIPFVNLIHSSFMYIFNHISIFFVILISEDFYDLVALEVCPYYTTDGLLT